MPPKRQITASTKRSSASARTGGNTLKAKPEPTRASKRLRHSSNVSIADTNPLEDVTASRTNISDASSAPSASSNPAVKKKTPKQKVQAKPTAKTKTAKSPANVDAPYAFLVHGRMTHIFDPVVWRQMVIPADMDMEEVAGIITAAFGWTGMHQHALAVRRVAQSVESDDEDNDKSAGGKKVEAGGANSKGKGDALSAQRSEPRLPRTDDRPDGTTYINKALTKDSDSPRKPFRFPDLALEYRPAHAFCRNKFDMDLLSSPSDSTPPTLETDMTLAELHAQYDLTAYTGKHVLTFEYDMGDGWDHMLVIERTLTKAQVKQAIPNFSPYGLITGGGGHGPAEDCGGPDGWEDLKMAFQAEGTKHDDEDAKELRGWYKRECMNGDKKGLKGEAMGRFDIKKANAQYEEMMVMED